MAAEIDRKANSTADHSSPGSSTPEGVDSLEYIVIAVVAGICVTCVLLSFLCKSTKADRVTKKLERKSTHQLQDDVSALEDFVASNLEQERFMTTSCFRLYLNKPWMEDPGDHVKVSELSSNQAWLEGKPFPLGETRKMLRPKILALWRFLFVKNKTDSLWCLLFTTILGLIPALTTELWALAIGSIQGILDSESSLNRRSYECLLMFVAGAIVINIFKDRVSHSLGDTLPGAGVRNELRQRLQRQFLAMRGDMAMEWPSGRCSAMLIYDVDNMVANNWLVSFDIWQHAVVVFALSIVVLFNERKSPELLVITVASGFLIFTGACINMKSRQPNVMDLEARKRQSLHAYIAMSGLQIHRSRELSDTDITALELDQKESDWTVTCAKAAKAYSKRGYHFYMVKLVSVIATREMAMLVQMAVVAALGREAFNRKVTVTGAVAVISSIQLLAKEVETNVKLWLRLCEGLPSLVGISEVLNLSVSDEHLEISGLFNAWTGRGSGEEYAFGALDDVSSSGSSSD